ncbi:MAG: iron ABC transporter permease, partial [Bauldia sp.]|nr:iron ABC transporter permease [Bauldia sp.]
GLLLSGSAAALIYAYVTRFLAVSAGGADAGLSKVSVTLDHSARTLGETATGTLRRVHLPLIRPALGAAAILVFVDCMKELPATLLLRPLNFETLATHLYGEAARGTYEDGAVAALAIVLVGLLPVALLARLSSPIVPSARKA